MRHQSERSTFLFNGLDDLPLNVLGDKRAATWGSPVADAVVRQGSGPLRNGPTPRL